MTTLADLDTMDRADLARLWAELMGGDVPASMSQPMQRRFLAFELQAGAEGGLTPALLARIGRIAAGEERKASPRIKPGARLLRAWNGVAHTATEARILTGKLTDRHRPRDGSFQALHPRPYPARLPCTPRSGCDPGRTPAR